MGQKLTNVISFFVEGVTNGDLTRAMKAHVSPDLIEHSPGIADGYDGLAAAYRPLVERFDRRYIRPIRGFEDGGTVVLQALQTFGYRDIERMSFDIVDTDADDMITAHWSVTAPVASVSIGSPPQIRDLDATAANKQLVAAYTDDVLIDGRNRGAHYLSDDPDIDPGQPCVRYIRMVRLVGCGHEVVTMSEVTIDGRAGLACDLYRLDSGVIVERRRITEVATARPMRAVGARRVVRNPGTSTRPDVPQPRSPG